MENKFWIAWKTTNLKALIGSLELDKARTQFTYKYT